jgi:hypothetical protein
VLTDLLTDEKPQQLLPAETGNTEVKPEDIHEDSLSLTNPGK